MTPALVLAGGVLAAWTWARGSAPEAWVPGLILTTLAFGEYVNYFGRQLTSLPRRSEGYPWPPRAHLARDLAADR